MTTRPSNDAIAQAFWTAHDEFEGTTPLGLSKWIQKRAREIDAAKPPKVEGCSLCGNPGIHACLGRTAHRDAVPTPDVIRDAERRLTIETDAWKQAVTDASNRDDEWISEEQRRWIYGRAGMLIDAAIREQQRANESGESDAK